MYMCCEKKTRMMEESGKCKCNINRHSHISVRSVLIFSHECVKTTACGIL